MLPLARFQLSYRILSDTSAQEMEYVGPLFRRWPYRRLNLTREILSYKTDILCLQEVCNLLYQLLFGSILGSAQLSFYSLIYFTNYVLWTRESRIIIYCKEHLITKVQVITACFIYYYRNSKDLMFHSVCYPLS